MVINIIKNKLIILKHKGKKLRFHPTCKLGIHSKFEGYNYIGKNTTFSGYMGRGTYVGDNSKLSGRFGRYTCIAGEVKVINGFHPINTFVSLHPSFYGERNKTGLNYGISKQFESYRYADKENVYSVIVGNDVWIGYGASILAGITIGDGAVIAAGAIVTKDVKPYSIVAGVPAKEIGNRFDEGVRQQLLERQWWNESDEWINKNIKSFADINIFLQKEEKI